MVFWAGFPFLARLAFLNLFRQKTLIDGITMIQNIAKSGNLFMTKHDGGIPNRNQFCSIRHQNLDVCQKTAKVSSEYHNFAV
jgi:hypothetical protein